MKIYWKNLFYNYTKRYYDLVKYYYISLLRRSKFRKYCYPYKKYATQKQYDKLLADMEKELKTLLTKHE